jgi:hypothetical protein
MPRPKGIPKTGGRTASDKTGQPLIRARLSEIDRRTLLAIAEASGGKGYTAGIEAAIVFWLEAKNSAIV